MNRAGYLLSVVFLTFMVTFLMAMGNIGYPGQGPVESPYNAKIKDTSNNEVSITSATIDGKMALNVLMGKGRIEIPFENISRIEVKDGSLCVTMKEASPLCNLKTNGIAKIYGKLPYGVYQISLKDVLWIELTKAKQ